MKQEDVERLPRYQCHKVVHAAQIEAVTCGEGLPPGEMTLRLAGVGDVSVDEGWVRQHKPQAGGYAVVYNDGYMSFSPAEPFEAGYALVPKPPVVEPEHEEVTKLGKRTAKHA